MAGLEVALERRLRLGDGLPERAHHGLRAGRDLHREARPHPDGVGAALRHGSLLRAPARSAPPGGDPPGEAEYPRGRAPAQGAPRGRRMRIGALVAALGLALAAPGAGAAGGKPVEAETVVLFHGLARTDRSMRPLAERLERAGYRVENLRYPSTHHEPEALVAAIGARIEACCAGAGRLHFVTHSLGGILLRAQLAERKPENLGRVVMLAPPNRGSELVDALGGTPLFEWIFGPTATELGTGEESLPNRLPPPDYEVGVIAGSESVNPAGSLLIEGESDGTVAVEHTKLPGMADFLVVPRSHPFIMRGEDVAEQVVHFLRHGRFRHEPEEEEGSG